MPAVWQLWQLEAADVGGTVSLKSGVQVGGVNLAAISKESVCSEESIRVHVVT